MKKILAMALLLTLVVGVAFAQVSGFGRIRTCVGVNVPFGDDNTEWLFPHHYRLGLRGSTDVVNFVVQLDANGATVEGLRSKVTADFGAWSLAFGRQELPWVRWSGLAFRNNGNASFGASNSATNPFVYASFLDNQVYVGITDGGAINSGAMNTFPAPGFFVGGDFEVNDGFSVGGAFAGLVRTPGDDTIFTFMAKAHASIAAGPATVGVNAAFYQNAVNQSGFFSLNTTDVVLGNPNGDCLTLEAMVDFRLPLDPGALSVTVGYLHNLSDYDEGSSAIRISGSFSFSMGGGFSIIPGFILTGPVAGSTSFGDGAVLQAGVSFFFGF